MAELTSVASALKRASNHSRLDVAERALTLDAPKSAASTAGRTGAAAYFFRYELPKIGAWLNVVESRDPTCTELPEEAF